MATLENEITVPDVPGAYPWQDRVTPVLPGEVWKTHPEWAHFRVSNLGRVWSTRSNRFLGRMCGGQGPKPSRPSGRKQQRMEVDVVRDGRRGTASVAVLVLETFVGPRPDGHDADHVDHDRLNNCLRNLRWRLSSENRADTIR